MEETRVDAALREVRALLEADDVRAAIRVLESLRPPDQAEVFEELALDQQRDLLPRLDVSDSADILEKLEEEDAAQLAQQLSVGDLADILDEMEPDEAADLLGDLPKATARAALNFKSLFLWRNSLVKSQNRSNRFPNASTSFRYQGRSGRPPSLGAHLMANPAPPRGRINRSVPVARRTGS